MIAADGANANPQVGVPNFLNQSFCSAVAPWRTVAELARRYRRQRAWLIHAGDGA